MRQRFEQQTALGITPISEVKLPLHSRDELPPVLMALQHIFITPKINEKVFYLLEKKVCEGKKKTGRKGMDLWHILVLAVVRHALDTNWDRLELIANYDGLTRQMLGLNRNVFETDETDETMFSRQSIIDNVSMIDEQLLEELNAVVVSYGQELLKKKGKEEIKLKTDSYALETNIHFPTDLNLLWDALRKCLDAVEKLSQTCSLPGWRKIKHVRRHVKSIFRDASQQVFRGKDEKQKKQKVQIYLNEAASLHKRFLDVINKLVCVGGGGCPDIITQLVNLVHYNSYMEKLADLTTRRLLKDEVIEASEKIYSIFEDHTEWINKGKMNRSVELGHLLLITTEQNQFIVDYKIMEHEKDASQIKPLTLRIEAMYPDKKIFSHSFDKGFYSKDNYELLQKAGIENIILPKRGKLNLEEKERESSKEFKTLRKAHSAVESNINMLEHHGLNRCPDKGLHGYKKYVGLSVLAYNLHIMGNFILAKEKKEDEKRKKQRGRYYRQAA